VEPGIDLEPVKFSPMANAVEHIEPDKIKEITLKLIFMNIPFLKMKAFCPERPLEWTLCERNANTMGYFTQPPVID
jgi:hypothetical protein